MLVLGPASAQEAITPQPITAQPSTPQSRTFAQFLMTIEDDFDGADTEELGRGGAELGSSSSDDGMDEDGEDLDSELADLDVEELDEDIPIDTDDDQPEDVPQEVNENALTLADVIASLYRSYPEINQARLAAQAADGGLLSAYGAYDTKFQAFSLSEPTGFYENYRNGLGLARQTWWGGYVAAGYRIGRGFYQPWYKERQTDDAGEFKVAYNQPLLQGHAIDPQRVAVFQASLARQAVGPQIQQAILEISRDASAAFWEWVAAGAFLDAQRELLELAEIRGKQFEIGVKAGKFAEIDLILNEQLIAERRAKLLETEQKFRMTAFKLSLFLRDETGQPMVPMMEWLPNQFPLITPPDAFDFQENFSLALARRPEPEILQFEVRHVDLDRQLATNQMLPRFDFISEASQDMGEPSTKSDDKGEFELVIGFQSEVPIQRRKARGKIQETSAKIMAINEKIRLVRDKIGAEIQIASNNLALSTEIVEQSEISLEAAIETLRRYRFAFERGKIDLISLNLLEMKLNETEIKLIEAQRAWFSSLAELQISLGIDPLQQAMVVSSLPPSDLPRAGTLGLSPTDQDIDEDDASEDDIEEIGPGIAEEDEEDDIEEIAPGIAAEDDEDDEA